MITNLSRLVGRTIDSTSEVIIQGFTNSAKANMTGALIKATTVYSMSEGKVVEVGLDTDNLYVITVQYTPIDLFRYCRLSSTTVELNDYVVPTDKLGVTSDGKLRFEYCVPDGSDYPVRISDKTYYKQNPAEILNDDRKLYMSQTALEKFFNKNSDKSEVIVSKTSSIPSGLSSILGGAHGNN